MTISKYQSSSSGRVGSRSTLIELFEDNHIPTPKLLQFLKQNSLPLFFFISGFPNQRSISWGLMIFYQVLAGSYFSVAGALVGVLKPGRMSMFGTLLVIWGLVKEGILGKPANTDPARAVYVYPTMLIALVCAFSSVKYDVKKVVRSAPARPIAKPLQSSSKSKLK